jgi:pyridoxine 5-phosphate synthase
MLDIACMVKPQDVCLVPEKRTEVTTEGGLDVITHVQEVQNALYQLNQEGIRVSLFIDPSIEIIQACHEMGVKIIELHTGAYANAEGYSQEQELQRIRISCRVCK